MLWSLLTNSNVVYVLLIVGLWATAAAFYVPGTGLMEVAAVLCLVLAIAGLTQLPVNVVGVLLILVAGVVFIVDLKVQSVALTVGAMVSLVLGSVFLFPPAEGARAAQALRAEGFGVALKEIWEAASQVDTNTMTLQYFETLKQLGTSPAKVRFPDRVHRLVGSVRRGAEETLNPRSQADLYS